MALYYYDKFTAIANTYPVTYEYAQEWTSETYSNQNYQASGYNSYTFDKSTGKFAISGSYVNIQANFNPGTVYSVSGNTLYRFVARMSEAILAESTCTSKLVSTGGGGTYYTKGSLVQSNIVAEDGTYPTNGRHSDGYWYVKKTAVGAIPLGTVTLETGAKTRPGNGRKLVRLDNGWWVAATYVVDGVASIWVSKDEGKNWELSTITSKNVVKNVTIAAIGNEVAILYTATAAALYYALWNPVTKTYSITSRLVDTTTQQLDVAPSMVYDKATNKVHIAMSVKYPGYSYNIAYAYSSDKGNTFSGIQRLTGTNSSGTDCTAPDMVVEKGTVYIAYRFVASGYTTIKFTYITSTGAMPPAHIDAYYSAGQAANYPVILVDYSGRIHIAFHRTASFNTTPHLFTVYSDDNGSTWKHPTTSIPVENNCTYAGITMDKVNTLYVLGTSQGMTNVRMYVSKDRGVTWSQTAYNLGSGSYAQVFYDPERRFQFGDSAETPPPFIMETTSNGIQFKGAVSTNSAPTIAVVSPIDNQTLYENDVMNISGDAYDPDKDQSVTAYYQVNSEPRKVLATNVSQTQISLTKQLKFNAGKLYDGDTAITGNLIDGVAHKLKVWAVDSDNASSPVVERTFYVVPNRAPLISVDDVVLSGVVDNDKFKISGTATDLDDNSTIKVTRRINSGNSVEIYSGPGGAWEFDIALAQLQVGENVILVEVIDNYGAKTSKTIKLNKNEVKTPILQSVARYKIEPPKGTAKGVLLFIERDKELDLRVELSMTLNGEQEQYETLTPEDTAQMPYNDSIVEDTFYYETTEAKDNIILKLTSARPDATVNHKIHLISGAVE